MMLRCAAAVVVAALAWLGSIFLDAEMETEAESTKGPHQKQVVIIGAGASGLVALKEMLEAGHNATVIEKGTRIGGIFAAGSTASYKDMYLTISNYYMAFSDFPPPGHIKYSSGAEYEEYLGAYAVHFGLMPHIRLSTEVVSAKMLGERWEVAVRPDGSDSDDAETLSCDSLIVATGSNQKPKSWKPDGFTGEVVHSSEYRSPDQFAGKRVLIIGTGESASDISVEIAKKANSTTVWSKRWPYFAPRFVPRGYLKKDAEELEDIKLHQQDSSRFGVWDFLEVASSRVYTAQSMALAGATKHVVFRLVGKLVDWGVAPDMGFLVSGYKRTPLQKAELAGFVTKNMRLAQAEANRLLDMTISETAVFEGTLVRFPEAIFANHVEFAVPQETSLDVDVVMLCTGYETRFDWLEADVKWNPRTWFKHAFPANYGEKLVFLGWARPHQGGIPGTSELNARYAALLLSGKRVLPANFGEIALKEGMEETNWYEKTPGLVAMVDWPSFTGSMADLIGCRPRLSSFSSIERKLQFMWYPQWPCWFRMVGPGANPDAVEDLLSRVPFKPHPMMAPLSSLLTLSQKVVAAVAWAMTDSSMQGSEGFKTLFLPRGRYFGNEITFNSMFSL